MTKQTGPRGRRLARRIATATLSLAAAVIVALPLAGAEVGPAAAQPSAAITAIQIPQLGNARLPIVVAGVHRGRIMTPPGVAKVGWVATSALPSDRKGTVVLVQHRDTGSGGKGTRSAFYNSPHLRHGAIIWVRQGALWYRYRVDKVVLTQHGRLPAPVWNAAGDWRRAGAPLLVFSTCGGKAIHGNWTKQSSVIAHQLRS